MLVTDVSTLTVGAAAAAEQVFPIDVSKLKLCFVGRDDDSVDFVSTDNILHVWSLPESQESVIPVNESLYSSCVDTLSQPRPSYDLCNDMSLFLLVKRMFIIKLWPPVTQWQVCFIQLLALIALRTHSVIQHRQNI